ncbi:MAG TPA: host-nuclease inhibitor Gam family protein, partial [Actinomycetota bacterium]|nr:host-nuclease inhibitor Gam family protein [Actinomycetota bacterium]
MSAFEVPDHEWDAFLARVENDPESVGADEMTIAGLDDANRAMRQLAKVRRHLEEVDAAVRATAERAKAWADDEHRRAEFLVALLENRLEGFHRVRVERDGKDAITIRLEHGSLTSNAGQATWSYPDEDAFLAWARENAPDLVNQPEPPPARPFRDKVKALFKGHIKDGKAVTEDGEVVPGLVVHDAVRKYEAKPDLTGEGR